MFAAGALSCLSNCTDSPDKLHELTTRLVLDKLEHELECCRISLPGRHLLLVLVVSLCVDEGFEVQRSLHIEDFNVIRPPVARITFFGESFALIGSIVSEQEFDASLQSAR